MILSISLRFERHECLREGVERAIRSGSPRKATAFQATPVGLRGERLLLVLRPPANIRAVRSEVKSTVATSTCRMAARRPVRGGPSRWIIYMLYLRCT